jgi:plasmid stability protein
MKAITLRNVPADVQRAIRAKARQKHISVNKAVIELLTERVSTVQNRKTALHHDLDPLAGSWSAREAKQNWPAFSIRLESNSSRSMRPRPNATR